MYRRHRGDTAKWLFNGLTELCREHPVIAALLIAALFWAVYAWLRRPHEPRSRKFY